MTNKGATCPVTLTATQAENRGLLWVIGSFVLCPCHLPVTLWLVALLLSGTAAGALLRGHPVIAGLIVTLLWLAGTWRGVRYFLLARSDPPATLRLNESGSIRAE
jgi:mercuric ion transport protein